ncbi:SRPBCC family protein [Colwellia psychrerythraea]|uniref:SRPBCC family protein n=1 Tax=Colwellia psychrerythraea TaxID=28229 RepID=A0A099L037_COLPS|nr:SRPBCC family protein [Colwellia psychrerythraea]KGJ96211.1 hypothetical protein GAB14E_0158 [Colwellia psychrerythraea]
MITIVVKQQVAAPLGQVSQALLDHAQLDRFFNAKITLIKPQNKGELLGGKGAIRQIAIGKIVFNEEIISASNMHICYRIVGKGPVSEHQGDIHLSETQLIAEGIANQSTQLDYVIQFNGPKWLPDFLLKFFVGRDIKNSMKKLALYFSDSQAASENVASDNCLVEKASKADSSSGKPA